MKNTIKQLLSKEHISLCGVCPLSECRIVKPYLLKNEGIENGSVILFAIPYFSEDSLSEKRNISAYAVCKDYHEYVKNLFPRLLSTLRQKFPENRFAAFADHSPIDERDAAVKCGIGIFGKNGLLISEEYSSYMFIAEIVTDACLEADPPRESTVCIGCGRCIAACPMKADGTAECLSATTQKKGQLDENEIRLMKKYNTFWGCDICQEVCPYTKAAIKNRSIFTEIEFFMSDNFSHLTTDLVQGMSDEEFSRRAYSWRKKEVILRNLKHSDTDTP